MENSGSTLRRNIIMFIFLTVLLAVQLPSACLAGAWPNRNSPPLDQTLMGFKDQGVWYFLCIAPEFPIRIGPSYQTYGPPPPCLPPMKPTKPHKGSAG